ncbi:MAG: hypothetical protein ACJAVZ_000811 [Afipia broomeae]|jgi:hypothetical protein|tara:strand:+ start:314 stop:574 length:261 start_codon:yes stop_codon:yes gene_type:complete
MEGTDNFEGVEEVAMTLLHPGRERRPRAIGFAGCSGTQTGRIAIQMCHEKMHLFCARFVVPNSNFAAQRRRNNFLFMPLARYINRK